VGRTGRSVEEWWESSGGGPKRDVMDWPGFYGLRESIRTAW
jgi:hypothetical protein